MDIHQIHFLFDEIRVPLYIVYIFTASIFLFAWMIAVHVGRIIGEDRVAQWYEERERARKNKKEAEDADHV